MMKDNCQRSYVGKYLKKMLKEYKIVGLIAKPKSYERFIIQCESCLSHNTYDDLGKIKNKTLVIGAGLDGILGVDASYEIHKRIEKSQIHVFEEYSHGVYDQTDEFNKVIYEFLIEK